MRIQTRRIFGLSVLLGCTPEGQSAGASASLEPDSSEPGEAGSTEDLPTTTPSSAESGSTGGASSSIETGSTGSSTTDIVPFCGDGEIDFGEECDEGVEGNSPTTYCTDACKFNICGDGNWFVGWELCDLGEANSDIYGSFCNDSCEPAARCGDSLIDAEYGEECDLGPDNGSGLGDEQGIPCAADCRMAARRVFVTEETFSGNLGGLLGADAKCRGAAMAAGLAEPEEFVAYLSTGEISANQRYGEQLDGEMPFITIGGTKIAESYASLISAGPLGEGIAATETGEPLYYARVATNTTADGASYTPTQDCDGWSSSAPDDELRLGYNSFSLDSPDWGIWQSMGWWASADTYPCNADGFHLYCFEL